MLQWTQVGISILCLTVLFFTVVSPITPIEGRSWILINRDGDVSSSPLEDRTIWNPHVCGFSAETQWNVAFTDTVTITLKTSNGEAGHLATGMWWTTGFEDGMKHPLHNTEINVEFDIKVAQFTFHTPGDWLRIALACAVQRENGDVVYTELDLLDSPGTLHHETGTIQRRGDIIYQFGDVVEYRIDAIPLGEWRHYQLELTNYIERAWMIQKGDRLESVYIVIESDSIPVEVTAEVDNLWITSR